MMWRLALTFTISHRRLSSHALSVADAIIGLIAADTRPALSCLGFFKTIIFRHASCMQVKKQPKHHDMCAFCHHPVRLTIMCCMCGCTHECIIDHPSVVHSRQVGVLSIAPTAGHSSPCTNKHSERSCSKSVSVHGGVASQGGGGVVHRYKFYDAPQPHWN